MNTDAHCGVALTVCSCCAAALLACAVCAPAADTSAGGQCFHVTFLSMRPRASIAGSRLCLRDNGTLQLSIPDEQFTVTENSYSRSGIRFSGTLGFERAGSSCRYRLELSGVSLMGRWMAGQAVLHEYVRQERMTQRLPFLFLATANGSAEPAPGPPVPLP